MENATEIIFRKQHHLTMEISPSKLHVSILYIFIRIISFLLYTRAKYHKLLFLVQIVSRHDFFFFLNSPVGRNKQDFATIPTPGGLILHRSYREMVSIISHNL
jgi:hypothetical protein